MQYVQSSNGTQAVANMPQNRGEKFGNRLLARHLVFRPVSSIRADMYAQMCIHLPVSYEWDPARPRANFEKHGIHFADAASSLE